MWIIYIKLKCFCCDEKLFLGQEKRNWPDFYGKIKLLSYICWKQCHDYVSNRQNRQTFVWVLNYMLVGEKVHLKLE